jgi:hypothetical protein
MSGKQAGKSGPEARERPGKNARDERLASALRANLKRRKQQARVREAAKDAQETGN